MFGHSIFTILEACRISIKKKNIYVMLVVGLVNKTIYELYNYL